jgi:tetratricopeptide (TPR) repeat protein
MKVQCMVLAVLLSLCLAMASVAQLPSWENENTAGMQAFQQRSYDQAEALFGNALKQASEFGELDPRYATALNNFAALQYARHNYREAESLYQHALVISEKVHGPFDQETATLLNNLATLF